MKLYKGINVLCGCGVGGFLLLTAPTILPAQAQSNTVHQLGVLNANDEQFSTGSYFDSYEIEGSAGQRVSISLDSSDFDALVGLFDSDGNLVATNDDAAEANPNSFISVTLPRDDTYTVVATSYGAQGSGDYRMALRNFSPPSSSRVASSNSSSGQNGWSTLFSIPFVQEMMVDAFSSAFSFGGGDSSYGSDYELRRTGNPYPSSPQPAHRPVTPIGGDRGFYGSDHTP